MSVSLAIILEDVPEDTRLWKPDMAPQAIVTKRIGKRSSPFTSQPTKAGMLMVGFVTNTPTTPAMIMPKSRNIERKSRGCLRIHIGITEAAKA